MAPGLKQARIRGSRSGTRNRVSSMNPSRTNHNQGGGNTKSGLVPSVGMGKFNLTYGLGRAFGSVEDRKKNFCFNQLSNVGSRVYQTRAPSDGVSTRCRETPEISINEQFKKMFQDYLALGAGAGAAKYGPVGGWDTSKVTKMEHLFTDIPFGNAVPGAATFNEDISGWDVSNVTSMFGMFFKASSFNQNVNNWNTGKVTNMRSMFNRAESFNNGGTHDVPGTAPLVLDTSNVTTMRFMFNRAYQFNQQLIFTSTSKVTDMGVMFQDSNDFNSGKAAGDGTPVTGLKDWDTSQVTDMCRMFHDAYSFNEPIGKWDTSKVTNMNKAFYRAYLFAQPIGSWKTGKVTDMGVMFQDATAFDQDISDWDTSQVTNMSRMFKNTTLFNQDLSNWNVSKVTNMNQMFDSALLFNNKGQSLNAWGIYNVTDFTRFASGNYAKLQGNATAFNVDISKWYVNRGERFESMFLDATAFDRDLSGWNISNEAIVSNMFTGATKMLAVPAKMPSPRCDGGVGVCYN